jgi:hypothetical protein
MKVFESEQNGWVFLCVIVLAVSIVSCTQGPPPVQAVNDFILAVEKNGGPPADALSSHDRRLFERMYGPQMVKEIVAGGKGKNAYEAYATQYFLQNTRRPPKTPSTAAEEKYRVMSEWIRGKYAEVDLFIPGTRSYLKPFQRVILLKEGGRWKIAPMGTGMMEHLIFIALASGKRGVLPSFTMGDFYDFCLEYFGFSLSLSNDTHVRVFPMSEDWNDRFKEACERNPDIKWALREKEIGFSHHRTANANPIGKLPVERQYAYLSVRPVGKVLLPSFIKKNPDAGPLIPRAHLSIAEQWQEDREFERAVEEYEACIQTGTPDSEIVILAKQRLAGIYWRNLRKLKKARPFIIELKAMNRLPKDLDIPECAFEPELIVLVRDPGYSEGIEDFDVHPSAKWVDVLCSWRKGGGHDPANRGEVVRYTFPGLKAKTIAKFDALFSDSKEYRVEKVTDRYDGIEWNQDGDKYGLWLYTTDRNAYILKLDENGKRLERRRDEGEQLTSLSVSGAVADLPWETTGYEITHHVRWCGVDFSGSSLFVFAFPDIVKTFDLNTFRLMDKVQLTPPPEYSYSPVRVCATGRGTLAGMSPKNGMVYEFGKDGRMIRQLRDIPCKPSLERVGDLECDHDGNLYVLLGEDHNIAVYSPDGRLLRVMGCAAYDRSVLALDPSGNIYINGKDRIFIYDELGAEKTSFPLPDPPGRVDNLTVKDLETPGDGFIYLRVGQFVQRYDYNGKRVDYWKMKDLKTSTGRQRELVTGPGGRVYVRMGLDFYLYKGENTTHWLTLPLVSGASNLPGDEVAWTRIDRNGVIYGYSYAIMTGYFHYNPGSGGLVKKFTTFSGADSYRVAMDRDGYFWFGSGIVVRKDEDRHSIMRFEPRGKLLTRIRTGTRRKWLPKDIVMDGEGYFVIADAVNNRLVRCDPDGNYVGEADLKPYSKEHIFRLRWDKYNNYYVLFRGSDHVLYRFSGLTFENKSGTGKKE